MRIITEITADYKQKMSVITEDNITFILELEYRSQSIGWYYNLIYENLTIYNIRLTTAPNILRRYLFKLPFSLSCASIDGTEPWLLNDFSSGRILLMTMSKEEVRSIEKSIYGQI